MHAHAAALSEAIEDASNVFSEESCAEDELQVEEDADIGVGPAPQVASSSASRKALGAALRVFTAVWTAATDPGALGELSQLNRDDPVVDCGVCAEREGDQGEHRASSLAGGRLLVWIACYC